jgi:regulator of cell morphogenesis and NO signaling
MSIAHKTIREIISEHPSSISVFERFEIDLCALGDNSLTEACSALSLSLDQLEEKLAPHLTADSSAADPASLSLIQLIQRIVRVHHRRIRHDLPALCRMAERLVAMHAAPDAEPGTLLRLLQQLHAGLLTHIDAEEQLLFPFIAHIGDEAGLSFAGSQPQSPSLHQSLRSMHQDHEVATQAIHALRTRTHGFIPPAKACTAHRALLRGLADFEQDLHGHLHLEDNILFPRALLLHARLFTGSRA